MDTNTLLRIYQTYSLEKISALSKQSLAAQYAQNEQLVQLNKELAANNAIANKILRNQIQELERQERGRFYKNLIFNLKLATDRIENQTINNFRLFLSSLFLKPIEAYAKESITNLEEIKDKEYAQQIIDRVKSISLSNQNYQEEYDKSAWSSYVTVKEKFEDNQNLITIGTIKKELAGLDEKSEKKKKEALERLKYERNMPNSCFGCSAGFLALLLIATIGMYFDKEYNASDEIPLIIIVAIVTLLTGIWKIKAKPEDVKLKIEDNEVNPRKEQLLHEIEELEAKNKEAEKQFNSISSIITAECNDWETLTNEIIELLPHDNKEKGEFDPKLEEAAHIVVSKQDGSTSLVQRKLAIGYNRAERIMNQLELVGVVSEANGLKSRNVLIPDIETLAILLSKWGMK
jgi:hypothetical protein